MSKLTQIALAGLAAAGLAGTAAAASHSMTVALPGGSVAHIRYEGEVAPKVLLVPVAQAAPIPVAAFDPAPFAALDRMMAEMQLRHAALMRQAAQLAALSGAAASAAPGAMQVAGLPAGTVSYTFVSSSSNGATCGRSVRMVSAGADAKPQVVSQTFGDCGALDTANPAAKQAAAPAPAPKPAAPTEHAPVI